MLIDVLNCPWSFPFTAHTVNNFNIAYTIISLTIIVLPNCNVFSYRRRLPPTSFRFCGLLRRRRCMSRSYWRLALIRPAMHNVVNPLCLCGLLYFPYWLPPFQIWPLKKGRKKSRHYADVDGFQSPSPDRRPNLPGRRICNFRCSSVRINSLRNRTHANQGEKLTVVRRPLQCRQSGIP